MSQKNTSTHELSLLSYGPILGGIGGTKEGWRKEKVKGEGKSSHFVEG